MTQAQATNAADVQEEQLNRAIEELRGVLREEEKRSENAGAAMNTDVVMDIPVEVQIVLGSTEMPVSELMTLQKGSTVALDRRIGEPVDVVVNGRKVARGEITVVENDASRFGVRLIEIVGATKPSR
jgi:flagellar motor switch protein FliN/FliY